MREPFIEPFEAHKLVVCPGRDDTAFENADTGLAFHNAGPFRFQRGKPPGETVAGDENKRLVRLEFDGLVEAADFIGENLVGGPAKPENLYRDIFREGDAKLPVRDVMAWRVNHRGTPRFVKARPPQSHIDHAEREQDETSVPRADFEPVPQGPIPL